MEESILRRNRIDLMTPAERAICRAVDEVEMIGTHPLLTDAINLLHQAQEKVADFVDLPSPGFVLEMPDMFKVAERLMLHNNSSVKLCQLREGIDQYQPLIYIKPQLNKKFRITAGTWQLSILQAMPDYDTLQKALEAAVTWVNSAPEGYKFEVLG